MSARRIFVIGATGAQGLPVCKGLVKDNAYSLRILTRKADSPRAQQIKALGDVEVIEGTFASEADLRHGFRGCWGAFVNIDGFNSGEKTELFWAIRSYELAIEEGIKYFVYGNLEYISKVSGYNPKLRAGHYDGKGRVGEWILFQNQANRDKMGAAVFTTGPYIEMNMSSGTLLVPKIEDGIATWRNPLGDGALVYTSLDDCEYYVRWLFDHPERSNGLDLKVAIDHIDYHEMTRAFTKVTGKPARWIDTDMDSHFASIAPPAFLDSPAGYNADPNDAATLSFRSNFTAFWEIWRASGGNKGVIRRDYALLDEIFPGRIKTAEEWWRREEKKGIDAGLGGLWERIEQGNLKPILKVIEDGRQGRL